MFFCVWYIVVNCQNIDYENHLWYYVVIIVEVWCIKRGFTLVELLAVIIILGLVGLIAIPSITRMLEDSKMDYTMNR